MCTPHTQWSTCTPTHRFLLPLLFDHVTEHFSTALALAVQQVRWDSSLGDDVLSLVLRLLLFMLFDSVGHKITSCKINYIKNLLFSHDNFFGISFLVVELGPVVTMTSS